ncbi:MAG TPA: cytochrome P450 [Acidimicrobiales bacterium]|jgi:cytochrome P450|nr:cytochrome P450 [Acidimicrobiales bacterium]
MEDRATADFDHHDPAFHRDRVARWAALRRCPVAYNPNYGGFWVVSGYDEVAVVSRDAETFSSKHAPAPEGGIRYLGIAGVPRSSSIPTQGIAEVEGPRHAAVRRTLNRHLAPPAIARLRPLMETTATRFLDQRIETGAIDLVLDFANPVPAILTMELAGLPHDGWSRYAELFHGSVAHHPGTPEHDRAVAHAPAVVAELRDEIAARRRRRRDDLITDLVEMEVDDGTDDARRLSDGELVAILWNLVAGGLDTTTALTSLSLYHLDEHRDLRQRLIEAAELLPLATDELLRYFSVNETLTRTVTRDVELGGQQLRRGDHLMLSWLSANRDERTFARPDEVVLDRERNPHLAFGVGPHRCIGMHMARTLFQVLVREVLTRIPDYEIDRAATQFYEGNPELNGIVRMPATFTPGVRGQI